MKLGIDTSSLDSLKITFDERVFELPRTRVKSQMLLPFLEELLKKEGKSIKDITAIEAAKGPGSFTGLRVGLAVANALSFLLQVPVNGKYLHKGEAPELTYERQA